MTTKMEERLETIYQDVLRRNPGEVEFHQAVREVLESLGPVIAKYPEFRERKIIERDLAVAQGGIANDEHRLFLASLEDVTQAAFELQNRRRLLVD